MSKSRKNAKQNSSYIDDNRKNPKADYPLDRNPKHNKQEPAKGLPEI